MGAYARGFACRWIGAVGLHFRAAGSPNCEDSSEMTYPDEISADRRLTSKMGVPEADIAGAVSGHVYFYELTS